MPTYEPFDWYKTPLYYDIIFDVDTQIEADFVEAMAHRYVPGKHQHLLEPACGSGRLMAALAKRGFRVSGFDLSAHMVNFSKQRFKALKVPTRAVNIRVDDMKSFAVTPKALRFGRVDLAYNLVSTFKYLLDEKSATAHLQRIARALRPGGVYVLGFHLTDYTELKGDRERWVAKRNGTHVTCNIKSWPPDRKTRTEKVRSRLIVKSGRKTNHYETDWTFRTYDHRQFLKLLASVPQLKMVATHDFYYQPDTTLKFREETDGVVVVLQKSGRR